MNTSLIYSQYKFNVGSREEIKYNDYLTGNPVKETFQIDYYSGINDYAAKVDFDWIPKPNHLVKFGAGVTQHAFATGILGLVFEDSFESLDTTIGPAPINATEISAYIEDDIKVNNNLKLPDYYNVRILRSLSLSSLSLSPPIFPSLHFSTLPSSS